MKNRQMIILMAIMLAAAIFVFVQKKSVPITKSTNLNTAIHNIPDYRLLEDTVTETWLIDALRLDDVSQKKFVREGKVVDLYVGYYFSIDKLSAAHSPLVCVPGNGWVLEGLEEKEHDFNGNQLKYAEVAAGKGESQILILYWFQAYDKSAPNMYINIYHALLNVITGNPGETAFVRTSVLIKDGDREEAHKTALDFVEKFYPTFIGYVKDSPPAD